MTSDVDFELFDNEYFERLTAESSYIVDDNIIHGPFEPRRKKALQTLRDELNQNNILYNKSSGDDRLIMGALMGKAEEQMGILSASDGMVTRQTCADVLSGVRIPVMNQKTYHGCGEYIGRPSPLGNPFYLTMERDRTRVIAEYDRWLREHFYDSKIQTELFRLQKIAEKEKLLVLTCWCAPKACHGDVIRRMLLDRIVAKQTHACISQEGGFGKGLCYEGFN